jgi:hypothetical protein
MDVIDHLNVMVYVVNDQKSEYPQVGTGKFIMFRQKKYGILGETLATVGGHIDAEKGEFPLEAAKREVKLLCCKLFEVCDSCIRCS